MSEVSANGERILLEINNNCHHFRLSDINMVVDPGHNYFLININHGGMNINVRISKTSYEGSLYAFLPEFPYYKKKYEAELAHRQNVAELVDYIRANKH